MPSPAPDTPKSPSPTQDAPAPSVARRQAHTPKAEALRIGGLTRLTTIDYPGELAAVVFCQGCPWRCRYCHNGDLLDSNAEGHIPWSDIKGFLEQRAGLLDALVFSGGEPTAQGALACAIQEARALGFKIGLHTNGAYPERLRQLLPVIDWVGLDIKALPHDYPAITGIQGSGEHAWESLALLLEAGIDLEVRTTLMPGWCSADVARLSEALAEAGVRNFCLQACDSQRALDPDLPRHQAPARELAKAVNTQGFASVTQRGI
ncbi:anaerobic ribonucleoside-triphosphate reductase activating protein [Thiorhodococcus mannitoliphagus]|uniref:Anaerobic ribonucleoside-triphosphate reductase activating protein n=1 Tax=Thiorhodococcus mannitoliphagus TaxID=329406 RepID=A0A6P1E2X6_9GAMM|nr:anaerobic ribonucleoside-triphosphate reductase activating protein [Thiorhodococcus mannitoliphagus]NEX22842.1 anaerobic ribonucleoside-triphosphate reductase activating protein [Thiorhodococcus mannitoliphagus]